MKDRFLKEVKKARESAATATSDLARQASETAGSLVTKAADVKEQLAEQASEMTDFGLAMVNETLADFNTALPVLAEAGYVVDGLTIKLGVPPKLVANFTGGATVDDERLEALLAEHAERKLTTLLVKSVHHAAKLQSMVNVKGLRPTGISVEIGLIPTVAVKFGRPPGFKVDAPGAAAATPALPAPEAVAQTAP